MGCAGSKPKITKVAEPAPEDGHTNPSEGRHTKPSDRRTSTDRRTSKKQSNTRKTSKAAPHAVTSWNEEDSRSIVGKLMIENRDSDGRRFEDEYDMGTESMGTGMSGQVMTARSKKTGVKYAIKTLNTQMMGVEGMEELRKEVAAMRRLDHPNIVRLYETFDARETDTIYMVLELCTGGELVQRMMEQPESMTQLESAKLVAKMLSALRHCHERDVVHRDIKLDNFVYESDTADAELKLIDFGLSYMCQRGAGESEAMKGRVGTLSYMAPEVLLRLPYTAACDMWSLGVVAFILLSARRPFHAKSREDKIQKILENEPNYAHAAWKSISELALDFVQKLLIKEPSQRMTAVQALQHEWILALKSQSSPEMSDPTRAIRDNAAILRSMQAFSSASLMEKIALELLAFGTPSADFEEMRKVFVAIDTDGSGSISREEFSSAMQAHPQLSDSAVSKLFDHLDFGKSGEIAYNEFLAATLGNHQMQTLSEQTVREIFSRLDRDHDGVVSQADLMRSLGGAVTEEEIDSTFQQLGVPSGKLFFMDLFRLMTASRGRKVAGVDRMTSRSSLTDPSSGQRNSRLSRPELKRSSTMSTVVLHSEASQVQSSDPLGASDILWIKKGRSVQNLVKFLKKSAGDGELPGGAASEPTSPHLHRLSSADGTTMAMGTPAAESVI